MILDKISKVFKSIRIEYELLSAITEHLKIRHEAEREYRVSAIKRIEREIKTVESKIDELLDHLLERRITDKQYDRKCQELKNRQQELHSRLEEHLKAGEDFRITVYKVLSLASRLYDLFISSKIDQKRQLINLVFSNLSLRGATLEYRLRKPFDLMVNRTTYSEWLGD